ncbi:MAG: TIGR01777 family oxidoreductase [Cycloclasticus sp.]
MNFLITGGTGLIGSALCRRLLADKHHIVILSRRPEQVIPPVLAVQQLQHISKELVFDVVINLAGEAIADKRWSESQKQLISSSRFNISQGLIDYLKGAEEKPKLLISGSAIGYYGLGIDDSDVDEEAAGDNSFSSQLCQQWESIALQAEALGIRCCLLRTGIVLAKDGGALAKLLPVFKMGLGGRIGSGKQWMPWIHLDDLVGIILHCIEKPTLRGAINGTAPAPVSNEVFVRALATALKRPCILPVPALLIKLLMGQMGEELLLSGKKVMPKKALQSAYKFQYESLDAALLNIISSG